MWKKSCLWLLCLSSLALAREQGDDSVRWHTEDPSDKAVLVEVAVDLPPFPDTQQGRWLDIYVNNTQLTRPKILLDGISIQSDRTVHYVLNMQSRQGFDNLSAESLSCSTRTYKVHAFGDTVNRRWVAVKQPRWQPAGSILSNTASVQSVLYQAFCVDGLPKDQAELWQRLQSRATFRQP